MTLTKLQQNSSIYMQLYGEVHNKLFAICEAQNDGDHLLVTRFNEAQAESDEFKKSLLELFYTGGHLFAGEYLKRTATDFYLNLNYLDRKTFTKEYVEFIKIFEEE